MLRCPESGRVCPSLHSYISTAVVSSSYSPRSSVSATTLTMRSTTVGSTLLLLAAAAAAQTTEQVLTIQTSVPTGTSSICYEVCVNEPCYACAPQTS